MARDPRSAFKTSLIYIWLVSERVTRGPTPKREENDLAIWEAPMPFHPDGFLQLRAEIHENFDGSQVPQKRHDRSHHFVAAAVRSRYTPGSLQRRHRGGRARLGEASTRSDPGPVVTLMLGWWAYRLNGRSMRDI